MIYARAFYNILAGMRGLRLFERFGFDLPKDNQKNKPNARVTIDYQEFIYVPEFHNWQYTDSEQTLFGYVPEQVVKELLENCIDKERE